MNKELQYGLFSLIIGLGAIFGGIVYIIGAKDMTVMFPILDESFIYAVGGMMLVGGVAFTSFGISCFIKLKKILDAISGGSE